MNNDYNIEERIRLAIRDFHKSVENSGRPYYYTNRHKIKSISLGWKEYEELLLLPNAKEFLDFSEPNCVKIHGIKIYQVAAENCLQIN